MTSIGVLQRYLPTPWMNALAALPDRMQVQEMRLRAGQAVVLSTTAGERYLGSSGVSAVSQSDTFFCSATQLEQCFVRLCNDAVYAHEWELQQGFLSVAGGIRVGVAGTAVIEGGGVRTVRDITSLCIRLPRHIPGCSAALRRRMLGDGHPFNTLLVGAPSSGKTTLLRDIAVGLTADGYRVTVVDERGELSGVCPLTGCDVLLGYPKAEGIRRAVRCLAPDVIVFDELGDEAEAAAVSACARAGVAVVASLHGYDPTALSRQSLPCLLADEGAFDLWAFLAGRRQPGQTAGYYRAEVKGNAIRWVPVDRAGGCGDGNVCRSSFAPPMYVRTADGAGVAGVGTAGFLHRPTNGGSVVSAGTVGSLR